MKLIIFDFDGVIADTFSFCLEVWNKHIPHTEDDARGWFMGNVHSSFQTIGEEKTKLFLSEYVTGLVTCPVFPDMAQVIAKLSTDHTLSIVSSSITPAMEQYLELHNIRVCFSDILGGDIEKDKSKKIETLLQKYQLSPADVLFVTDTVGDLKESRTTGVKSVGVSWGYHSKEQLALENPDFLIDTPDELFSIRV